MATLGGCPAMSSAPWLMVSMRWLPPVMTYGATVLRVSDSPSLEPELHQVSSHSTNRATASTRSSECRGPMLCNPTGNPAAVAPTGTLLPGCCVGLNGWTHVGHGGP